MKNLLSIIFISLIIVGCNERESNEESSYKSKYDIIYAHMRKSNIASKKAAIAAGFRELKIPKYTQLIMIWKRKVEKENINITPVIEAIKALSSTNTGALIVFSKNSELKFYVDSGDLIDAFISKRLLIAIFNKYSPLHDGAVIVHQGKVRAARCILPVSERDLPAQFGMRHRAALGMSEATDTLVLIVSEETGQMSLARNGQMDSNLSVPEIRKRINTYLLESEPSVQPVEKDSTEPLEVIP